ncbi:MAG: hypothetical protein IKP65_01390 [Alphaproteobacteria bacterium]|nr:hypothetical protein [Alphaproteobacteria bacterium]
MANNTTRYYPLVDEIKNHIFQWATENDFKKLPKPLIVSLNTVIAELRLEEGLKKAGLNDDRDDSDNKKNKKAFFELFKKKYLEMTGVAYNLPFTPLEQINVDRIIKDANETGSNYVEFLDWIFDDFYSIEYNKNNYYPPSINFIASGRMFQSFSVKMQDTLKMRQKNGNELVIKNKLLEIALDFVQRIPNKDFSKKIMDYNESKITHTKFLDLMKKFAEKLNDQTTIEKCKKLLEKG